MYHLNKTLQVIVILSFTVSSLILCGNCGAGVSALSVDLDKLYDQWYSVYNDFLEESFRIRMQYEFSGEFIPPESKRKLRKTAIEKSRQLKEIIERQKKLKKQIEDYNGEDWDERFGETSIWRNVYYSIYKTSLRDCEIEFYSALTYERKEQNEKLHLILERINELNREYRRKTPTLIKARTLAELAEINEIYSGPALKEFGRLWIFSDYRPFKADILKLKLQRKADIQKLRGLNEFIIHNELNDHYDLIIPLASLQRRFDPDGFRDMLRQLPRTKELVSELLLNELFYRFEQNADNQIPQQTTVFEAGLASEAAWEQGPQQYKQFLECLVDIPKFQTPLITYVAASSLSSSAGEKAVTLLIKSSQLQEKSTNSLLEIAPVDIAHQAAELAYSLFEGKSENCLSTLDAFENYLRISEPNSACELRFYYSRILQSCGKDEKSRAVLERLASSDAGKWQRRSRLEVALSQLEKEKSLSLGQKMNLLGEFYLLSEIPKMSVRCRYANAILMLLEELNEQADLIIADAETAEPVLRNWHFLAELAFECVQGPRKEKAKLISTELFILANKNDPEKLSDAEDLIENLKKNSANNLSLMRCKARLLTAQSKFSAAGQIWSRICTARDNPNISIERKSPEWWRARYFQLYCFSRTKQENKKEIYHTIEVLQSSSHQIPQPWARKFAVLKEQTGE